MTATRFKASVFLAILAFVNARDTQIPLTHGGCPANGPLSCSDDATSAAGSCCLEAPGVCLPSSLFGEILTDISGSSIADPGKYGPATGPSDSWTIHGLWPDNCDLTFKENCDRSRAYKNIAGLLEAQGAQDTLDFMKTAVAFFQLVVNLFQTLPTYTWLANHGITPSSSGTHTLQSLKDALRAEAGVVPALDCQGKTLDSVSWYFNLRGSLLDATPGLVAIDAPEEGNCPQSGIRYPIKGGNGGHSGKETPVSEAIQ
ncbi:RNase Gf29 [Mycena indigotica]|uniref:RNase Gf29 n=1 Tax=Mycena indigotica TaxID=2126181 RepID=A0A8H6VVS0_9AGAR|nr:RNase Gf29 [Mycena indigotica]KAF7295697.1 RNase Gf29 [Mycena indigotica]